MMLLATAHPYLPGMFACRFAKLVHEFGPARMTADSRVASLLS